MKRSNIILIAVAAAVATVAASVGASYGVAKAVVNNTHIVAVDGRDGKDGVDGRNGIDGIDGRDGRDGPNGRDGQDGRDGKDGQDGRDGKDGHTPVITIGDDGDWYVDGADTGVAARGPQGEKGDKGDTGAQGEKGEKGDKGDTGATGAQGEKGEKGDKGDPGEVATPAKDSSETTPAKEGEKPAEPADSDEESKATPEVTYLQSENDILKYNFDPSKGQKTLENVAFSGTYQSSNWFVRQDGFTIRPDKYSLVFEDSAYNTLSYTGGLHAVSGTIRNIVYRYSVFYYYVTVNTVIDL